MTSRKQTITWANVDPNQSRDTVSLDQNELTHSDICPSDDEFGLASHQEGIETEMIDT